MNSIQDVREAQQMWEYKFKYAGREGIVLTNGKSRSLSSILGSIIRSGTVKPTSSRGSVDMSASKSRATS